MLLEELNSENDPSFQRDRFEVVREEPAKEPRDKQRVYQRHIRVVS